MKRHLARKNTCPPIYSEDEQAEIVEALFPAVAKCKAYACAHCSKSFASSQSRSNHTRVHHAPAVSPVDAMQLASVVADLQKQLYELQNKQQKRSKTMKTRVGGDSAFGSDNTFNCSSNTTINNNVTQNIVINAFGHENTQHISKQFLDRCVRRTNKGLVELIEKIHFDKNVQENFNLCATNKKVPLLRVHDGLNWSYGRKDQILGQLVDKGHGMMQEHFDGHEDNIRDSVSESMFNHIRVWMDKMHENDKKTWEDVLTDMYILILNATEKKQLATQ